MFPSLKLSVQTIVEKEFKTSMRGYNQDEVDKFLDIVIKDYEMFQQYATELQKENERLKKQANTSVRPQAQTTAPNVDVLQRLSNLEKTVFDLEKKVDGANFFR